MPLAPPTLGLAGAMLVLAFSGCTVLKDDSADRPTPVESDSGSVNGPGLTEGEGGFPDYHNVMRQRVDAAFSDSKCLEPKPHATERYQGPLIDTHFHVPLLSEHHPSEVLPPAPQRGNVIGLDATIDDIACTFHYEGTDRVIAFHPTFPVPYRHQIEVARRAQERYPDLFTHFTSATGPARSSVEAPILDQWLGLVPGLFAGFGEIQLCPQENDPRGLPPDDPLLLDIYPVLREHKVASYFHLCEGNLEAYERVLSDNPDLTFIFHGGNLVDYDYERNFPDYWRVEQILRNHDNVYYTADALYGEEWLLQNHVTREEFFAHFVDYEPLIQRDLEIWGDIIARNPDTAMWGTDRGAQVDWSLHADVGWQLNDYARAFIARLDSAAQEKFAYKNAERALGLTS